jgi:hypothetical protein
LQAVANGWRADGPGSLGWFSVGGLLQQLDPHLPNKLLIDRNALLRQSMDDRLWCGVQAEAKADGVGLVHWSILGSAGQCRLFLRTLLIFLLSHLVYYRIN